MSDRAFTGTGVAMITPFRKDGSIDFKSLEKLINFLIGNKADYLVALGTTGETPVLSKDEKNAIVNFVIEVTDKRVPIVVGIGSNNTNEVVEQIKATDFTDIAAVLSVGPYYNKPSQAGYYEHYKSIVNACPVPVIVYNVPGRTGSNISAETTLKLAADFKRQIIAVKEASGNFSQIMNIMRSKPDWFHVISGDDALTFPMLALGGSGVVSVIANALPLEFSTMVRLALEGKLEESRKIHYNLLPLIEAIFAEGSPAGVKALLDIKGISSNYLRLPLMPVSREMYKKMERLVGEVRAV